MKFMRVDAFYQKTPDTTNLVLNVVNKLPNLPHFAGSERGSIMETVLVLTIQNHTTILSYDV